MSVLVTGATGYLGGRLVADLHRQGQAVHCVVRPGSSTAGLERSGIEIHVDPGDGSCLRAILEAARPRLVYHLATCYLWDHLPDDVPRLVDANLRFAACLAEAAVAVGAGLINTGTGFQHAGGERIPVSLYAVTKQAFEDMLSWYASARGLLSATVILNDTYGPRDPRRKLFHQLRTAAREGRVLAMSPGEQIVDLLFSDDAVAAIQAAGGALSGREHRRWLAASGEPQPLRSAVARWALVAGVAEPVAWGARPYREREVMEPWLAGEPPPGWVARTDLDRGLALMERDP